ncbi:MAG: hypothetical protein AAB152_11340 [Candidatus Coatesbacteria bacterium]
MRLVACLLGLILARPAAADGATDPGGALGSTSTRLMGVVTVFAGYAGTSMGKVRAAFDDSYGASVRAARDAGGSGTASIRTPGFFQWGAEAGIGATENPAGFLVRFVSYAPATLTAKMEYQLGVFSVHEETNVDLSLVAGLVGPWVNIRAGGFNIRGTALAGLARLTGTWKIAGASTFDFSPFGIFTSTWGGDIPVEGTDMTWEVDLEVTREVARNVEAFAGLGYGGASIGTVKVSSNRDLDGDGIAEYPAGMVMIRDAEGRPVPFELGGIRARAGLLFRL